MVAQQCCIGFMVAHNCQKLINAFLFAFSLNIIRILEKSFPHTAYKEIQGLSINYILTFVNSNIGKCDTEELEALAREKGFFISLLGKTAFAYKVKPH